MAFNPDQYLADKAAQVPSTSDTSSFNPDAYLAQANPPGALETGLRGAANGATLGFEPAIAGGLAATGNVVSNVLSGKLSLQDAIDQYKKTRDSENAANEAGAKAHPVANIAGNLVGGGALAALTGGAGLLPEAAEGAGLGARLVNAGKVGTLYGAASGLGNSISAGQGVNDTVKNVGEGVVGGLIAGPAVEGGLSAVKGIGGGLINELADTNTAQKFKKAFDYGRQGVNLTSKSGLEAAQAGVDNAADNLGMAARTINKQAGAAVGNAKQALQDNGNTFDLNPTLDKIQTAIENLKQSDHPSAQNDAQFLQKYLDNLTQKITSESGLGVNGDSADFKTANDIKQALTDFGGTSGNGPELKTTDALNASKLAAQDLQNNIVGNSPELADANQKASASYKALNALGIDDSHFETDPLTGEKTLTPQGEAKLANTLRQSGRGSETQSGQNAGNRLSTALDYLKIADPEQAAQLQSQVTDAGQIHSLAQQGQGNLFGKSGLFDMTPVQAGNRLGRLVQTVTTPVNTLAGAVSQGASDAAKKVSTAIQPLTDTAFGSAAKQLVSSGSAIGMKLGSELAKAIGKDNAQKNAILFSLMQQPGYREHLQNFFGDSSNNQQ